MKTRNIALMLFAGVALLVTSCVNEREIGLAEIGKDSIAFRLDKVQTKAATEDFFIAVPEKIASFKASTGETYAIEETVTSLDGVPETKGTPAFTENVYDLYTSFSAVANPNNAAKKLDDAEFTLNGDFWSHYYWGGVWDRAPFLFYMRMPSEQNGVSGNYTYDDDNQSIKFSYESPTASSGQQVAALQQDILFASTTLSGESENGKKKVTFYHALTGIKFSNFYTNTGIEGAQAVTKTIIKEVTLSGVKDKGNCEMIFKDATDDTRSKDVADWKNVRGNATFTLSYSDTTDYTGSAYGLDTLLNSTGKARNINNEDGTLTFWVVPQAFEDSTVMISMTCDLELVSSAGTKKTVQDTTITVSLGKRNWQAGELHTFTLKPIIVGVELEDDMDDDKWVKSNVRVDNTGNVFEYVRVNMIGNWVGEVQTDDGVYDDNEVILMGYTTDDPDDMTEVEFWNDKDGLTDFGTFKNLTPKSTVVPATSTVNGWVRYDKYYYYTLPIGPNDAITDQLFEKYTVGVSPEFWIPDQWGTRRKARNVHLVIDLMVQAIPAPVDENGNVLDNEDGEGYIRAWLRALDKAETDYDALLDL